MEEQFGYIEQYFNNELAPAEREAFEQRCATDPAFAEAVGFYIAARQQLNQELQAQKKKEFDALYQELKDKPARVRSMARFIPYAAAACIILFAGWFFLWRSPSPQTLAGRYIAENLQSLPGTMSGAQDSLQLGIAAFNRKDYAAAQQIFAALVYTNDPEAYEKLGVACLAGNNDDCALSSFETLSSFPGLHTNRGPFYKAITLMKRGRRNDRQEAKRLLQDIIDKQQFGNQQAAQWIKYF